MMELKRTPAEKDTIKSAWFAFIVYPIGIFVYLIGNSIAENKPFVPIGIVGVLSAGTILLTYFVNKKLVASIFTLIFWRTVCDLMISIAFLFMPKFQNYIEYHCDEALTNCHDDDDWMLHHENRCLPMSLWLEFFQIASESWLLCITYDLVVTISNPFTSLSYRIKYYHFFSWGMSSLMIMFMVISKSYGVYYVDGDIQSDPLCWIKNREDNGVFSPRPWLFLLIPLFIYYSYAIYVIRCAREMLDPTSPNSKHSGLLKTHFHRLFALDSNARTIKIYVGYWLFFLSCVFLVFISVTTSHLATHSKIVSTALSNLVLFCFGAKGYVDLIVFSSILLSRSYQVCAKNTTNGEDYFHLNKGLKLQLMTFITSGLKKCNEEIVPFERGSVGDGGEGGRGGLGGGGGGGGDTIESAESRMWTIKVKPRSDRVNDRDVSTLANEYLTTQQYCEYLEVVDPVQVEAILTVERPSGARLYSKDNSVRTSEGRTFSFKRGRVNELLLDVEIPERRTSHDRPELSKTVSVVQEETNAIWSWLKSSGLFLHENGHEAVFEEYLPEIFGEIRRNRNIQEVYQDVFQGIDLEKVGVSESGASGAIFFFSRDNQFIAKSCTVEEMNHIKSAAHKLKDYFQENPNTLITQIYGAYRLQMYAAQIFFFVSRNVLWTPPPNLNPPLRVDIYDLKGSTYKREFKNPPTGTRVKCRHCNKHYRIGSREMEECTSYRRVHEPNGVRKDNDFFSRLPLLEGEYDRLMFQVTKDLNFLSEKLQVIDYSWLVGISKVVRQTHLHEGDRYLLLDEGDDIVSPSPRCVSGNYLSVMPSQQVIDGEWKYGIIDYQQQWNWRKILEAWVKTSLLGQQNISCAPPKFYRDRQYRFIESTLKRISINRSTNPGFDSHNGHNNNRPGGAEEKKNNWNEEKEEDEDEESVS